MTKGRSLYQKSLQKINGNTRLRAYHERSQRINDGLEEDDYTNHFHSHFGFFDVAYPLEAANARTIITSQPDPKRGDNTYAQIHNESSRPSNRAKV